MIRAKNLQFGLLVACGVFVLAAGLTFADDKNRKDKPALSGAWAKKEAELKIEFADKNVARIVPHGDDAVIVIVCEYTVAKDGRVNLKVTDFEGKDEAKAAVKEKLPVGTEFSFKWKVEGDAAKLDDKDKADLQSIRHDQQEVADLLEELTRPEGEPQGDKP